MRRGDLILKILPFKEDRNFRLSDLLRGREIEMGIKISEIKIQNRYRKNLGSLDELCNSIKEIGLLHPVVINENNELVAGVRRIRAFEKLGYDEIPVYIVNLKDLARGEVDENVRRKNFTPSEMVAIWQAMESYQGQQPLRPDSERSRKIKRASKILNISVDTLSKAKAVVDYAEEEGKPELVEEMDKTGNVNKGYGKVRRFKEIEVEKEKALQYKEDEGFKIIQGDFREITKQYPDNYFNHLITDPPYSKKHLSLWSDASKIANRILKPGGFCITYSGTYHLNEVMNILSENLEYYWQVIIKQVEETQINQRKIFTMYKPLLVFSKPPVKTQINYIRDIIEGAGKTKELDDWQQPVIEAEDILERFTEPNDLILDPMAGTGTILIACRNKKRKCIGIEIKEDNINIIKGRLSNNAQKMIDIMGVI